MFCLLFVKIFSILVFLEFFSQPPPRYSVHETVCNILLAVLAENSVLYSSISSIRQHYKSFIIRPVRPRARNPIENRSETWRVKVRTWAGSHGFVTQCCVFRWIVSSLYWLEKAKQGFPLFLIILHYSCLWRTDVLCWLWANCFSRSALPLNQWVLTICMKISPLGLAFEWKLHCFSLVEEAILSTLSG